MAHAIAPEPHLSVPLDPLLANADPVRLDAERHLADLARVAAFGDTSHEELLEKGDVWNVILDIVQKHDIDLIVAGTRGRRGVRKLVMGSNAEKIYRQANCPVLTIGPHVTPLKSGDWTLKQILFPTDSSEASFKALPYALSLTEENQATLIVFQVLPFVAPEYRSNDGTCAREALRALVPAAAEAWCKADFVVRFDLPAEGILGLAEERNADLIVMGVRRPSAEHGIAVHRPWPVASQVVAEAKCPVLTVRG
jgi:nucleotide-binding universal stress UspA family protein